MMGKPNGGERRCPDGLVVRGQREHLSELERQALSAHLAQCPECRGAAALSALFDAVPDQQPGDEALIARVADRAVRAPRRLAPWPRWQVAAAVAVAVLTCGAATAAWVTYRTPPLSRDPQVSPRNTTGSPRRPAHIVPLASPPQPVPVSQDEPPAPREPAPQPKPRPSSLPAPTLAPSPTAAVLFAEANALRRRGETRQAVALYQSLRQRFPESSQAVLSAISVGDLLLAEADATGAVAAYSDYLRDSPRGALTEEALFGRARALRMLGRGDEERRTWEELLRRYPRSAYQPTASRRLRELAP
jgi:hypothetical protein